MTQTGSADTSHHVAADIFSGLGLGLLVGLIVGLAVSPVVSIILGALASLLAAFLGLQRSGDAGAETGVFRVGLNGIRIGSFGFACVAGILSGLYMRSHDVFSVPLEQQVEKWTNVGYGGAEARQLVVFERLGIVPQGAKVEVGERQRAQSSSLFSSLAEIDLCHELSPERYENDTDKVLRAYRRQDNEALNALADRIAALSPSDQGEIFEGTHQFLCALRTTPQPP